ncbi:MAG: cob(I)yrinic acid a,c-diamide adenosyltransferase [Nitrosopumilaceae archaeon]
MKIYTKTGDSGTTGLQGDVRISKTHPRIIAYGTIDEANASLGIALSYDLDSDITDILNRIQNELFVAGADLSNPDLDKKESRITPTMITKIEQNIDQFEKELSPLTNFILPGGDIAASHIHYSRTIVRRAEIHIVSLKENEEINEDCLKYINRLSDLLFVLGRVINKRKGKQDVIWKP